jgi:hypothetical protein
MYSAWIEYIDSNGDSKKKFVGDISNLEELTSKIFLDEYINEYLYMPQSIIVIRKAEKIINRYIVKKNNDKIFLISLDKFKEIFGV